MRVIFSALGVLAVVLLVGLLAKKQLTAVSAQTSPAATGPVTAPAPAPQQQLQQFTQNLDAAMQQARPIPDDK